MMDLKWLLVRRITLVASACVFGMIAAYGYLTPVHGSILQEVIDFAVILKALRALRIAPHELTTPKLQAVSSRQADIA